MSRIPIQVEAGVQVGRGGGARWPEFPDKGKCRFLRYGGGSVSKRGCRGGQSFQIRTSGLVPL